MAAMAKIYDCYGLYCYIYIFEREITLFCTDV